ncbi:MAG: RNA 2',3'-cyclic phosphodiesterase [bacterium]
MEKKRLFIGTFIKSEKFFEGYKKIVSEFSPLIYGKWVEIENLHFTYKFLGDVDTEKIPEILNSLEEQLKTYDSSLVLKGLGVFPNPKSPRVFFVNIINNDRKIYEINKSIETNLSKLGFKKEQSPFKPHLSLQRIKSVTPEFQKMLPKFSNIDFGLIQNFSVNLVDSQLTQKGPIYTIIK